MIKTDQIKQAFNLLREIGLHQFFSYILHKIAKASIDKFRKLLDSIHSTYNLKYVGPGKLDVKFTYSFIPLNDIDMISKLCSLFIEHRFDLLGSGWTRDYHGMSCRGVEGYRHVNSDSVNIDADGSWLHRRINRSNLAESINIWNCIPRIRNNFHIDNPYVPIDWHLDFKSGYRWSEGTWHKNIRYGDKAGADVKVPWELSRMQHLPQLAYAYGISQEGHNNLSQKEIYLSEFCCQLLDFIATNPPRFGVNWKCTMDVAIRVSNWLVAYDLFMAAGAKFDEDFERYFIRSIYEHGKHIIENLEWSPRLRHNHYLADIVGLLFVSAYLPRSAETDAWLAFSIQEFIKETELQFNPDGSNFEASTCYHRLSTEMVIYSTALILGLSEDKKQALLEYDHRIIKGPPILIPASLKFYPLPIKSPDNNDNFQQQADGAASGTESVGKSPLTPLCQSGDCYGTASKRAGDKISPLPPWFFERLERMAEFTMHVTKPNGKVVQIGDNDSGRFLKAMPCYHNMKVFEAKERFHNLKNYCEINDTGTYYFEDMLDHRHIVGAVSGIIGRDDFNSYAGNESIDRQLVAELANHISLDSNIEQNIAQNITIRTSEERELLVNSLNSIPPEKQHVFSFPFADSNHIKTLKRFAYPDFGIYIFQSDLFFLTIRCGSVGRKGQGGHAHNDQLAIELYADGKELLIDPGTYLYTPLPHRRNEYRSVQAHFAPRFNNIEPGRLHLDLFTLKDDTKAKALYFGAEGFIGVHYGFGFPVYRSVAFSDKFIGIRDYFDTILENIPINRESPGSDGNALRPSPAYGVVEKAPENMIFSDIF